MARVHEMVGVGDKEKREETMARADLLHSRLAHGVSVSSEKTEGGQVIPLFFGIGMSSLGFKNFSRSEMS